MNPPIGFVLLLNPYNALPQAERLIQKLNDMFSAPPIACHHDFSKNPNFLAQLPPNVQLVTPHVVTKWADFSCVEAAIQALRLLYSSDSSPDWWVYLSGSDYPIKPADRILADLQSSPFDAHIEHILVERHAPPSAPHTARVEGHKGPDWPRICHRRYCSVPVTVPWVTKKLRVTTRVLELEHPVLTFGRLPFSSHFRCFAGEAWFCANRRAAKAVLDSFLHNSALVKHYRKVLCPEESYFHTVLANEPGLRLSQDPLRYMDWIAGGNHPKLLTSEDTPRLAHSQAHFARKFPEDISPELLANLDSLTLSTPSVRSTPRRKFPDIR